MSKNEKIKEQIEDIKMKHEKELSDVSKLNKEEAKEILLKIQNHLYYFFYKNL